MAAKDDRLFEIVKSVAAGSIALVFTIATAYFALSIGQVKDAMQSMRADVRQLRDKMVAVLLIDYRVRKLEERQAEMIKVLRLLERAAKKGARWQDGGGRSFAHWCANDPKAMGLAPAALRIGSFLVSRSTWLSARERYRPGL